MEQISIRALRIDKGFSQNSMAEAIEAKMRALGNTDYHLSGIGYSLKERGVNPFTFNEVRALCDICGVSIAVIK